MAFNAKNAGLFLATVAACMLGVCWSQVVLQAEEGGDVDARNLRFRSNAEGFQTVWVHNGDLLTIRVCLTNETDLTVDSIRFSRDGEVTEAVVSVDGQEVGSFNTSGVSNRGLQWNEFSTTNDTFDPLPLSAGQHRVEIALRDAADPWGVEIDQLVLSFSNNATQAEVSCDPAAVESSATTESAPSVETSPREGDVVEP